MTPALAIIVSDPARVPVALAVAAAAAALGRPVAILFDGASVASLTAPPGPRLAAALDLGVAVTACQTGMADAGLAAAALVAGIATGGMIGFLDEHRAAQLLLG